MRVKECNTGSLDAVLPTSPVVTYNQLSSPDIIHIETVNAVIGRVQLDHNKWAIIDWSRNSARTQFIGEEGDQEYYFFLWDSNIYIIVLFLSTPLWLTNMMDLNLDFEDLWVASTLTISTCLEYTQRKLKSSQVHLSPFELHIVQWTYNGLIAATSEVQKALQGSRQVVPKNIFWTR